jgi:hypothetical protein
MRLTFELWDIGTGSFLEVFASEAEMLNAVREYARIEGDAYLDALAVRPVREVDGRREWLPEIDGSELRSRAIVASRDSDGAVFRVAHVEQPHDAASRRLDAARGVNRSESGEPRSA